MALAFQILKPAGYLFAAYRPIPVQVRFDYVGLFTLDPIPPIVFCDIYFNGKYYKTLSSTVWELIQTATSFGFPIFRPVWTFDVADAAQEYLRSLPPPLTGTKLYRDSEAVASMYLAARGSTIDTNGFTQVEGPAPIQGDYSNPPVAGGGVISVGYQVLNSTMLHEDNPSLATHLSTYSVFPVDMSYRAYPVSHRPGKVYTLGPDQYDHFPIVIPFGGLNNVSSPSGGMTVFGKYKNGTSFQAALPGTPFTFNEGYMYYVPTGIPQLSALPWSTGIVWGNVATYQVSLFAGSIFGIFWESPVMTQIKSCSGGARLHFLNSLGGYDAVNFSERIETQTTKSDSWQKSLPVVGLQKTDSGRLRFGVRSNKEVAVRTNAYPETAQAWLEELSRSPRAYIEWQGSQGQPPSLIPVRIADGKVVSRKAEERYEYLLELTYEMSNEKIVQRG